ncbi:MAG: hypothetical protein V4584_05380 [Verrucomicrobiota bacterium]
MRKNGRTVVIPMLCPINPGTLKGLIEQAGVTMEEFVGPLQEVARVKGTYF